MVEGRAQPSVSGGIVLAEPLCAGVEHAPFSAALILTALEAFPDASLEFLGEQDHIRHVQEVLSSHEGVWGPLQARVQWRSGQHVGRVRSFPRGLARALAFCRAAAQRASAISARGLIVTSLDQRVLIGLKLAMRAPGWQGPVLGIFHSALSAVSLTPRRLPWLAGQVTLRDLIERHNPPGLKYVVLGPSILAELNALGVHAGAVRAIEHPYLWEADRRGPVPGPPIHFGSFGGTWKGGVDAMLQISREVRAAAPETQFSIIGRVDGNAAARLREADVFAPAARLSWDDYRHRASAIHYSLGIADPEPYRLTASGSFLDTLSYVKPGLFLRNRYVEACFQKLGDIGYLCDSVDHMVETARTIVSAPPIERYRAQCENIRRGRGMFSPPVVAGELATLLADTTAVSESRAHSSAP